MFVRFLKFVNYLLSRIIVDNSCRKEKLSGKSAHSPSFWGYHIIKNTLKNKKKIKI